jgi:hypothetical protein
MGRGASCLGAGSRRRIAFERALAPCAEALAFASVLARLGVAFAAEEGLVARVLRRERHAHRHRRAHHPLQQEIDISMSRQELT